MKEVCKSLGRLFLFHQVYYCLVQSFLLLMANQFKQFVFLFEKNECWNLLQTVFMAQISISLFIDIDFDDGPSPFALLLFFIKEGCHLFAGIAPGSTELDDIVFLTLDSFLEIIHVLHFCVKASQKIEVSEKHLN